MPPKPPPGFGLEVSKSVDAEADVPAKKELPSSLFTKEGREECRGLLNQIDTQDLRPPVIERNSRVSTSFGKCMVGMCGVRGEGY